MLASLIVFFASIAVFFRRINVFPLRNWDEAWYAAATENMAGGNYGYIMQFWNGRYYFDHSPLYFWLSTPFFKIFGPGEWQARIVSTTAAVLVTLLIFLIGKKLVNERVGLISAVIFLTFGGVVMRFAHGNLDALLSSLFLCAFYFYLSSEKKSVYSVLSGISIGFGILVKSWGIGLFPVYSIVIYSLITHKQLPKRFLLILFMAFLTFSWWYLLGILSFGREFVNWFVLNPSENRLSQPFATFSLDYVGFALRDIGLWVLPAVIFIILKIRHNLHDKADFVAPFLFVSLTYIVSLNFLSDKSDWYIIPALPLLALVLGYVCDRLLRLNFKFWILFFAAILLTQYFNVLRIENIYPDRSRVGAELGVRASEIIPAGDEVILDDHDFTAFLYYSNQLAVYTIQDDRKVGEWWILKDDELNGFLMKNTKTWIVTKRLDSLPLTDGEVEIVDLVNGYAFVRMY